MRTIQGEHERQLDRLNKQLRQLILMRETGPKSAAWHQARTSLIWRLHHEIEQQIEAIERVSVEALE
ncbi:MAG: hypothetical protein GFH27_549281n416 [Chloroflexi bacterium AL-W]|nr:hypothetical protein [Chloroflexi bacterium AL-N1]NOK66302.1 hypothetical protein [Chloroflexi bacterium AL-N10]NOK73182.1 hypothetical protein [Chloroflexi bacterium AL-N5]NOK80079.1 hypothetical protein [Chloroflexi bacterium AL-W]NOK88066.1 hypothetical protein [Chloroflexi bacterium AL-N15]